MSDFVAANREVRIGRILHLMAIAAALVGSIFLLPPSRRLADRDSRFKSGFTLSAYSRCFFAPHSTMQARTRPGAAIAAAGSRRDLPVDRHLFALPGEQNRGSPRDWFRQLQHYELQKPGKGKPRA